MSNEVFTREREIKRWRAYVDDRIEIDDVVVFALKNLLEHHQSSTNNNNNQRFKHQNGAAAVALARETTAAYLSSCFSKSSHR